MYTDTQLYVRMYVRTYVRTYIYTLRCPDMLLTVQLCRIAILGLAAITAITEPQLPEYNIIIYNNV